MTSMTIRLIEEAHRGTHEWPGTETRQMADRPALLVHPSRVWVDEEGMALYRVSPSRRLGGATSPSAEKNRGPEPVTAVGEVSRCGVARHAVMAEWRAARKC